MTSPDYSFDLGNPSPDVDQTQRPRGRGCMKWGAIVVAGFFVFMGLVTACGPDTREVEVPGPTTTMTVTEAADPADTETTTVTTTVIEEVTEEVTASSETVTVRETETSVAEPEPAAGGEAESNQRQGALAPPSAAPAPAPTPTSAARTTYANCTDVWNRLGRPITPADPGYTSGRGNLDGNSDGVGCESDPR